MSERAEFQRLSFETSKQLFDEGAPADAAYLIIKGEVELRVGTRSAAPRVLGKAAKGQVVGEMALFDNQPRMASAVATTQLEAIRISREAFRQRMDEMDPVMKSIVLNLVRRVRELDRQVGELRRLDWKPM
jgi:CRP/FNR family transcriptional regulator, cyclic AMP receptor protein